MRPARVLASLCISGFFLAQCSSPPSPDVAHLIGQAGLGATKSPEQGETTTPLNVSDAGFIPSGWMGDAIEGQSVVVDLFDRGDPHSGSSSVRITYTPGRLGWSSIGWQYPESNWGQVPGRNWAARGFREASVWARGAPDSRGMLPVVQFKAGGHTDAVLPHQASFAVSGEFVRLTEEWRRYTLDLAGRDLSNVAVAFAVVFRAQDAGADPVTLWIDDIEYR